MDDMQIRKVTEKQIGETLFGVRKAVSALKQLCHEQVGGDLYYVVTERVDAELEKIETKLAEWYNGLVDRCNEARARLAGDLVDVAAMKGRDFYTTGKGVPVGIKDFGISRIGQSDAWCLMFDGKELDGTALPEGIAMRIIEAVDRWRDAKNAELEARREQESEAGK